jgi:RNA polymerase sigma factor (sigma-70 family)
MTTPNPLTSLTVDEWDALIISIVKRYFSIARRNSNVDVDDLKQEAWHALMRACKNHDPEKAAKSGVKFSTYAYAYIDGQLRRYISNSFKAPTNIDIDSIVIEDEDYCLEDDAIKDELASRIFTLAEGVKNAELLVEHFVHGKTYRQIAKELGVSHNLIYLRIHAVLNKIQEELYDDNY